MRRIAAEALAASFAPGEHVFLPGAAGECATFTAALTADPSLTRGLEITTSFAPGINPLPIDLLAPDARVRALFMQPGTELAQADGRLRHLPLSYGGFVRELRERERYDAVVVHIAPPDASGRCSLGVAAEFTLLAAACSARVLGVINPQMPSPPGAPSVLLADLAAVCELDAPLRTYDPGAPNVAAQAIARVTAPLIAEGATVQLGLGKAPAAISAALASHRRLRFWSGMLSDGLLELAAAGALAEGHAHVACTAVGAPAFYARLAESGLVRLAGCDLTHDAARLGALPAFTAVQGALEVDLLGQANLEQAGGRTVSGAGGAPDFARAASRGSGLSIVALPATAGREGRSRIVPHLSGAVTLARHEVDVVATEHGAADLRGLGADARACALAEVAAPQHREHLLRAWRDGMSVLRGNSA